MKLEIAQRQFLIDLIHGVFNGRTPALWEVWDMGLIATAGGPSDFYITPAGRAALRKSENDG